MILQLIFAMDARVINCPTGGRLARALVLGVLLGFALPVSWAQSQSSSSSTQTAAPESPDAADQAAPDPESMLLHFKDSRFWLSGQANFIFQIHPDFHADYSGPHSLGPDYDKATSRVMTVYTGVRLNNSTELLVDIEEAGGAALSQGFGLAGNTDLDIVRPDVQNVIPNNVEFIYSAKPFKNTNDNKDYYTLYLVNKEPELTGGVITNARANIDPSTTSAVVDMEMNSDGASEWSRITGANIHKRIAIILDGVAFSAPVVQGKIPSGRSQISGMANMEEAKLLEIILKAGALPAPVDIIEQRTIGPSLGQDSVNKGLASMIISYLTIGLFMIFYYRRAGDIAAAILFLLYYLYSEFWQDFGATLTLPGMAGIVLTMGMAVDANVLIYERIREELGIGKTIKASVEGGFTKAMPAIS